MYPYKSSGSERIERIDVIEKTREEIEFYRFLGYKNKDIALLFSSNNDLDEMAKALKSWTSKSQTFPNTTLSLIELSGLPLLLL